LSKKYFPKKLISRHNKQPNTLTRQEYKGKTYVKINRNRIRILNQLKSRFKLRKKIIPDPQHCLYGTTVGSQESKYRKTTITYEVIDPGHGGGGEERGVGHLLPGENLPGQRVLQASCKEKES
jgi:hypothetical protein